MDKIKTDEEEGNKEEGAKGRKRRKSVKADACGAAGPPTGEIDPITATIEAVLANASALDTSFEKSKKIKRGKKRQQEENTVKTPKQDGEKSAADDEQNDDDSSTTGNEDDVNGWLLLHGLLLR